MLKSFIAFLALIFCSHAVQAEGPACLAVLENSFFNPTFVSQALSLHDVSQSAWSEINRALHQNARNIPQRVKAKARAMHPNPLESPFDSKQALKVFREVLFEVLSETVAPFGITNPTEVYEMITYIQLQQQKRFSACFGDEKDK